jgi:O-antigen/teichoic acid export membrane protein
MGLFVIVKVANHYGPTDYGLYEYALSINTIIGVIILLVDGRVTKKLYNQVNAGHVIYNTTIAKCLLSFITLIVGITLLFFINRDFKFNSIYILLLLNNIAINLGFGFQNYFEFELKSKKVVIASNIATLISSLMQIIVVLLRQSIVLIAIVIVLSSVIKLVILYIQFTKIFQFRVKTSVDKILIKEIIIESAPLAIAAAASTAYHRIDQVMIGSILGVSEVGIYSISAKMISVVAILIGPLQVSIFPKMIEWYNNDRKLYFKRYQTITSLGTWIYIVGIAFTFIIIPYVFKHFFSNEYIRSLSVFRIHVVGTFFSYNAILRSSHFTLTKNTHVMMITQIAAVFLNIALNYSLIPIIGIKGAALATALTEFFSLLLLNIFFIDGRKVMIIQLKGLNPKYIFDK